MKLSIITPILNNDRVLLDLIDWFCALKADDLELIIVDQSENREKIVKASAAECSRLKYFYTKRRGLSRGRNFGLNYAEGEYVCFFDDTARPYSNLHELLRALDGVDILLASVVDESGDQTSYSKLTRYQTLTLANTPLVANSNAIFCRRECAIAIGFDEKMGVGRYFGACEELDFLFRALEAGYGGCYYPDIKICHPVPVIEPKKAKSYALGHYYFARKLLKRDMLGGFIYFVFKILIAFKKYLLGNKAAKVWARTFLGAVSRSILKRLFR